MVIDRCQFFAFAWSPEFDFVLALGPSTAAGDNESAVGAEEGRGGGSAVSAEEAQRGVLARRIDVHGFVNTGGDHQLAVG